MGIIATILAFGMGGFVSTRNQYLTDSAAEEIVISIRSAQNKAIAVERDQNGAATKIWGVKINNIGHHLISLVPLGANNVQETATSYAMIKAPTGVQVDVQYGDPNSLTSPDSLYVFFVNPFGTGYISPNIMTGSSVCFWINNGPSQKITHEFYPNGVASCDFASTETRSNYVARITLSRGNGSSVVVVSPNGDTSIE